MSDEIAGTSEDEFSWEKMEVVEGHEYCGFHPSD